MQVNTAELQYIYIFVIFIMFSLYLCSELNHINLLSSTKDRLTSHAPVSINDICIAATF